MSQDVTPAVNTGPISQSSAPVTIGTTYPPLMSQTGLRYPLCAVQGGSLIYSPMMGQPLFPWRSFSPLTTPTTPVSVVPNINLVPPSTQATPTQPLSFTSLMQLPGYPYMTMSSLLQQQQQQQQPGERTRHNGSSLKRDSSSSDAPSPELNVKRPRLIPDSQTINTQLKGSQRSPVIKLLTHNSTSDSIGRSTSPIDSTTCQHSVVTPAQVSQVTQTNTVVSETSNEMSSLTLISSSSNSHMTDHMTGNPPNNIVLIKCLGSLSDNTVIERYGMKVCTVLQELYYPSRLPSSTTTPTPGTTTPLSPETCVLLTINYLSSLHDGEVVSFDVLRSIFQYTQSCESHWLQYYRKHKKMSESTFVQCQFVHFARISVYPNTSKVWVIVSQHSLSEGITMAMQGLAKSDDSLLPEFVVVVTVHQNIPVEFCVLVINSFQGKWMMELQYTIINKRLPSSIHKLYLSHVVLSLVRKIHRQLCNKVQLPFLLADIPRDKTLNEDEIDECIPVPSHVVEHRPKGPFSEQYNVAFHLLQRVLSSGQLDCYQRLDFFVLSPAHPPLISQLIKDVRASGLVQHLNLAENTEDVSQAIKQRVISCHPSRLDEIAETISAHPHILFLVIIKCAHVTSRVSLPHRSGKEESPYEDGACDSDDILSHSNAILLYTSAQPFVLQTNRSLIPVANEVHWPVATTITSTNHPEASSGMDFCSILSNTPDKNFDWVNVKEDSLFEQSVAKMCDEECFSTPIITLRAQLLINDYITALTSTVREMIQPVALPETQAIVNKLVHTPVTSLRGYGVMIIIRCYDKVLGLEVFSKLKAIRNSLGLQYRFEVIFDNGDNTLTISDHFQKRLKIWGIDCYGNPGVGLCYEDLENLPCLVIMTGRARPNVRLPSSLSHVDLRLCHTPLNRTLYESDLSIINSYRHVSSSCRYPPALPQYQKNQGKDNDIFVPMTTQPLIVMNGETRNSTSSSGSTEGVVSHSTTQQNVIEWKPQEDDNVIPSDKTQLEYQTTEMDCNDSLNVSEANDGVAVVEIPQPEDHLSNDIHEIVDYIHETEEMLFNDLDNYSDCEDSETEEGDGTDIKITCLLSRQYYLIWKSGGIIDHSLLLPPGDGVIWQTSNKRPLLYDHSPSAQSSYYRTCTKPEGKGRRVAMDTIIREQNDAANKRFLLTGPAQVGKTGSCLLLVQLLQDYLRSSQGVTAISRSPHILPLLSHPVPTSPIPSSYSPIVPLEFLKHSRDLSPSFSSFCPKTPERSPNSILINAYSSITHDATHSCPKCSSFISNGQNTSNQIVSSILSYCSSLITIQWSIPSIKLGMVAIGTKHTIEYIKLPDSSSSPVVIPIYSISPDLKDSALLNLSHSAPDNLHIIVTKMSNFSVYQKTWPQHIISGLPDHLFSSIGSTLNAIKTLAEWNYLQNVSALASTTGGVGSVLPWILIMDDTICMVQEGEDEKSVGICDITNTLIQVKADVVSLKHWCTSPLSFSSLNKFVLDSNFLLLNLSKLTDINFNALNFKSADIDFHLRLLINGYTVHIPDKCAYIKKLVKREGSSVSLTSLPPDVLSQPDRLVTSLHHDSSSLLSYPGPLLLENFLLYKSHTFFPLAQSPSNSILMVDNYINLGPTVHVTLCTAEQLIDAQDMMFAGLVLYLCEGRVTSQQLQKLRFVSGSCLLLITRDCKGLVKEVSRLDLEETWRFKLRDEFQTSCDDSYHPLFFLTGKYVC